MATLPHFLIVIRQMSVTAYKFHEELQGQVVVFENFNAFKSFSGNLTPGQGAFSYLPAAPPRMLED